jgi:hypothetical protein
VGVSPALGMIGRGLVAFGILGAAIPASLQAQVGLTSGAAQVALMVRAAPRASVNGVSPTQETARLGTLREGTIKVHLSANTAYRLVVVSTQPAGPTAGPSRLWVRAENGRFEELTSGAAVTVARGHHADGHSEPEMSFRSENSASGRPTELLPVRYEVRIEPTI